MKDTNTMHGDTVARQHVVVYHYLDKTMGYIVTGPQDCGDKMLCEFRVSRNVSRLRSYMEEDIERSMKSIPRDDWTSTVTVFATNIHQWLADRKRRREPVLCELPTNLTFAHSEESFNHRGKNIELSWALFDGYGTTLNTSTVQRMYEDVVQINESKLWPSKPFPELIKGASFLASNCGPKSPRHMIVMKLRESGFRVDGIGRCLHTQNIPEGVEFSVSEDQDIEEDYKHKKTVLSKYLFHLAFENDIEPWHITEKPYHALYAGTVPVYLGAAAEFKTFLPHPKSVIFVDDYHGNITALAAYLSYLSTNETAYEELREWRKTFTRAEYVRGKPELLTRSWYCRLCDWAWRAKPNPALHNVTRAAVTSTNNRVGADTGTGIGNKTTSGSHNQMRRLQQKEQQLLQLKEKEEEEEEEEIGKEKEKEEHTVSHQQHQQHQQQQRQLPVDFYSFSFLRYSESMRMLTDLIVSLADAIDRASSRLLLPSADSSSPSSSSSSSSSASSSSSSSSSPSLSSPSSSFEFFGVRVILRRQKIYSLRFVPIQIL
jgi:Glycosyltransferase family 10 (fucosyltransferase) C-term